VGLGLEGFNEGYPGWGGEYSPGVFLQEGVEFVRVVDVFLG